VALVGSPAAGPYLPLARGLVEQVGRPFRRDWLAQAAALVWPRERSSSASWWTLPVAAWRGGGCGAGRCGRACSASTGCPPKLGCLRSSTCQGLPPSVPILGGVAAGRLPSPITKLFPTLVVGVPARPAPAWARRDAAPDVRVPRCSSSRCSTGSPRRWSTGQLRTDLMALGRPRRRPGKGRPGCRRVAATRRSNGLRVGYGATRGSSSTTPVDEASEASPQRRRARAQPRQVDDVLTGTLVSALGGAAGLCGPSSSGVERAAAPGRRRVDSRAEGDRVWWPSRRSPGWCSAGAGVHVPQGGGPRRRARAGAERRIRPRTSR
jgi:hypothetical protein